MSILGQIRMAAPGVLFGFLVMSAASYAAMAISMTICGTFWYGIARWVTP